MLKDSVRQVQFKEHPVIDISNSQPHEFDITAFREEMIPSFISSGKFLHKQYCACLLQKLFQIKKSEVKAFLLYHCEKLSDPLYWLHKLEKLIDLNNDVFSFSNNRQIEKVLSVIEVLRDRYETQSNFPERHNPFNFWDLKKKLAIYNTYPEKISMLLEAKTEYLQKKPHPLIPNEIPFDEKVQLELELIHSKINLEEKSKSPNAIVPSKNSISASAKINCNLNQFVDVFYQLMNEKKLNNLPFLQTDNSTIAEILSNNFVDKNGQEISSETIRTILKPSRIEKRPKGDLKINIEPK